MNDQIKPTYYVCHPGGNYSVADPQPVVIEQAEKVEPVATAWAEGYRAGVEDERTSEDNIGIAGFGMKVEPARENPYRTSTAQPLPELIAEFYEVASGMRTRAFNNVTVKSSTLEMFASEVDALTTKLADMLEADAVELTEAESDLNEHWQIIEKFQIKEKELYTAAQLALNALLKKNGKWGQGHDELETKAIASLKSALEIKTDAPIK